jgi:hypothetical protein
VSAEKEISTFLTGAKTSGIIFIIPTKAWDLLFQRGKPWRGFEGVDWKGFKLLIKMCIVTWKETVHLLETKADIYGWKPPHIFWCFVRSNHVLLL